MSRVRDKSLFSRLFFIVFKYLVVWLCFSSFV